MKRLGHLSVRPGPLSLNPNDPLSPAQGSSEPWRRFSPSLSVATVAACDARGLEACVSQLIEPWGLWPTGALKPPRVPQPPERA